MGHQTLVRKPILQGTTPRIRFQIVDEDGAGFQPDALTMSVYDVDYGLSGLWPRLTLGGFFPAPATQSIVNSRNDVDVLSFCDTAGNVELFLEADDTDVTVPGSAVPATLQRRVLFIWTWDTPTKVGKHEILLTIAPDRETEAS